MLRHQRSKLTALFCLALATASCAGDPERDPNSQAVADAINVVFHHGKWRQVPATPENHAETIVFEQRVAFGSATALLDRTGTAAIDRLLKEADPAPGSLIRLSVAGSQDSTAVFDRMTLQRLESVRIALANRGYESALADSAVARVAALQDEEVGLTVTKVMAVLPDCDQPQPLEPDPPSYERGFGCSNTYNLGVMIADPADLARGRPLDPADAERSSLSVLRYRIGEEEPLVIEDTKSQ
ncbi:MAG: CpaD family pilus assembly lipoprotein [Kiloniellaceae bacterium]